MKANYRFTTQSRWFVLAGLVLTILLVMQPINTVEAQNNPRVYRVELRLETADINNAGTDDKVYVKLNNDHITWLDRPRDDFERRDVYLYDLMLDGIGRLDDIHYFWLNKQGTDGWCVKRIEVFVNRGLLLRRSWPGSQCHWIDGNDGHAPDYFVPRDQFDLSLPGNGPAFNTMNNGNLKRIIETAIGHDIATRSYYWGSGGSVNLRAVSGDTLHVQAFMRIPRRGSDGTVEMNFDLVISCQNNGNVRVRIANPRVEHKFSLAIYGEIYDNQDSAMEAARRYLRQTLNRRVRNCSNSNTIVVTAGPEVRIRQ